MGLSFEVRVVPLSQIVPYHKNPRVNEAAVNDVARSIREFGWQQPIVVDEEWVIIAGHTRRLGAMQLGEEYVPVKIAKGLTEAQKRAYRLMDNRSHEKSEWDEELLEQEKRDILALDEKYTAEFMGFDAVKDALKNEGNGDEDEVPEAPDAITRPGDLWLLGDHRVLCGDSSSEKDVLRLMGEDKAQMVFTDPPYGVSYEAKTKEIANQRKVPLKITNDEKSPKEIAIVVEAAFQNIHAILAKKSAYYICSAQGGDLGLMMLLAMDKAGIPCRHQLIWKKNSPVFSMGRLDYDYQHEPILFGWSPRGTHHRLREGQWQTSVWECDKPHRSDMHPTMKPVALVENALLNSCPGGGLVYDPFLGSGTTLVAAEKTGRKCRGIEIDPHYCDVIKKRWEDYTGLEARRAD